MISLPIGLVVRIVELLGDIAKMKPGFEIYETANKLTKDIHEYLEPQKGVRT